MSQELPTGEFKWVSNPEKFTLEYIEKLVKKNKHGYLLEVLNIPATILVVAKLSGRPAFLK